MTAPLLAVEDLSVRYAGPRPVEALRSASLSVAAGEAVGIVGESGSGKSTLIAAVAGLLAGNARVTSGAVRLRGEDLRALPPAARRARLGRDIALVFQDPMSAFSPVLTLGEQLVDFQHHDPAPAAEKRERAAAMLAQVGISAPGRRLDAFAHELSGGMRQRAAIAAALLARPAVLIADEPTSALDATMAAQILHLLGELGAKHAGGVAVVTHHLGAVAQLCDGVAVMYAGEVVEAGPVAAVFRDPAHPYTAALLACDPARGAGRRGALPTIPGEPPSLAPPPAGCAFAARCPQAAARCGEPQALRMVGPGRVARCWRAAP